MNKLLYFVVLMLFCSCNLRQERGKYELEIRHIDNALEKEQNSTQKTLIILGKMKKQYSKMNTSEQMYYQLVLGKAQNKAFVSFTTDSIIKQVTEYYEYNGTSNEKMQSCYILGCVYRDLNKLPMALRYYMRAIEYADTTDKQVDFKLLARIYGQIGSVYHATKMPSEALEAYRYCKKYAQLSNDSLLMLQAITNQANVFEDLKDTTKFLQLKEFVSQTYLKMGKKKKAALALCSTIGTYIKLGDLVKAKSYMDKYEVVAGLIDEKGTVAKGKEIYYLTKGNYYLKVQQLDSAKGEYERLLYKTKKADEKEAAYRALNNLYQKLGQKDSIAKYANLTLNISDQNNIGIMSKNMAEQYFVYKTEHAEYKMLLLKEREKWVRYLESLFILGVCLAFSFTFYYYRQRNLKRMMILKIETERQRRQVESYLENIRILEEEKKKINAEKAQVKKQNEATFFQMKNIINKLEYQIRQFENPILGLQHEEIREKLKSAKIRKDIYKKVLQGKFVSLEEIDELKIVLDKLVPKFNLVFNLDRLNANEVAVCVLTKFYFSSMEVQNLMGFAQGYASTLKKRIGKKIFTIEMSPKEFDERIHRII